jgi:hypothetical protein
MALDSNCVLPGVRIRGYGFKSSSGPAQAADVPKPDGVEEDWYFDVGQSMKPCSSLPENPIEIEKVLQSKTVITGVPVEVIRKIAPDCGNNPTKKYDFVVTTYQAIEAAKVVPAVKLTFTLSGLIASNNSITGILSGTAKAEVFNSQGVNAYSVNIDAVKLTATS